MIKKQKAPYFVRESKTGYVVIGDNQRIKRHSLFLCKQCVSELHLLTPEFRYGFLTEMSIALKPFIKAFKPEKLNYELLRVDGGVHMRGIYFPEETAIRPGPALFGSWGRIVVGEISSLLRRIGSFKDTVEHRIGQALVIDRLLDHHTSPAEGPVPGAGRTKTSCPEVIRAGCFAACRKSYAFAPSCLRTGPTAPFAAHGAGLF